MFDFKDKVVLVTGASGIGIGNEIARRFFEAGALVACCSRSEERINKAVAKIGGGSERISGIAADMSDPKAVEAMVRQTEKAWGRIDILVNNAGVQFPKPSVAVTLEDWENTVNTNLRGYFFMASAVASGMIERGVHGAIVNIGSVNAITVVVEQAVYAATKAGISQMTKSLAREWGKDGIRVNCVGPGSIPTLINKDIYADPAAEKAMCEKIPMGRRGKRSEIADAVLYFASDYASYITGQTLFVDGGLTLVHG
jgi:NAD(P)-dependent dehydrogenase (short-subunit alcohol dehydrogenase family)